MKKKDYSEELAAVASAYPDKCIREDQVFGCINPGDRIFVGTGCGEPRYLVEALIRYVSAHPKAFVDTEILQVWNLGVTPYADEKYRENFRYNSFFIGENTRDSVNRGLADYTPVFLSAVPALLRSRRVPVDVALIQTSLPDEHGFMSLGISVDIVMAAVENAATVIAQVNPRMPRVHGDTFIHADSVSYMIPRMAELLEFEAYVPDEVVQKIGVYVSQLIRDGDTVQVGYGSIPNAILSHLSGKRHLGVHTELLSDGIVDLIRKGVVDNSRKELNRNKTVATFCMGSRDTYDFIDDNPSIEFRPVDYTNNPLTIARNSNVTAINSALEIDLTGQATAESIGKYFFSGIGGQADFMRGAILSPGGKTILALQATAQDGEVSRIVPYLNEGAGVTLTRGDLHYVVTEFGIAYLHGKNIRERAMDLIAIAHPKFRHWLIEEARKLSLIYQDQAFIQGVEGDYPQAIETARTLKGGMTLHLRPVKISDEPMLKDFFYSLSGDCMYHRFISSRRDMPHSRLQEFVVIDYSREMVILAISRASGAEAIIGMGQYFIDERTHTAEVAFVVRDDHQGMGVGSELLSYLTYLARKNGLHGFTAEVLMDNRKMLQLFEKAGFRIVKTDGSGVYELEMAFR